MITTAYVNIWGKRAGALAWDENEQFAVFEYDPAFEKTGWQLSPIHMPMKSGSRLYSFPQLRAPRNSEYDTFKGLPGMLADCLPDKYGSQLMNIWLARQGRPTGSMNPVEKLCFIGTRGMGALEFDPALPKAAQSSYSIELDTLVDVSRQMLERREGFLTDLQAHQEKAMVDILKTGTSAGGARPKAVIAYNEKTNEVRSGQAGAPSGFEHWIIKLDGVSDVQLGDSLGYGRVEMAYYNMAIDSGITMMESRLMEENGRAHFMTKRYDRGPNNEKHHIQTWCGMSHYDFNDMGSYSYEQLFETMRILRLDYQEAEQMFRRMTFNVLARNCDDHTKNFAFILRRNDRWRLAPAYDLCHAYRPDSIWVSQHALSINGKRKDHRKDDLLSVARSMNIKKAEKIISEIAAVVHNWKHYANDIGVSDNKSKAIQETFIQLK